MIHIYSGLNYDLTQIYLYTSLGNLILSLCGEIYFADNVKWRILKWRAYLRFLR